jgi:hypothetical protein
MSSTMNTLIRPQLLAEETGSGISTQRGTMQANNARLATCKGSQRLRLAVESRKPEVFLVDDLLAEPGKSGQTLNQTNLVSKSE